MCEAGQKPYFNKLNPYVSHMDRISIIYIYICVYVDVYSYFFIYRQIFLNLILYKYENRYLSTG